MKKKLKKTVLTVTLAALSALGAGYIYQQIQKKHSNTPKKVKVMTIEDLHKNAEEIKTWQQTHIDYSSSPKVTPIKSAKQRD